MSYKPQNQRVNKFKDRDVYTIKRVDMSQYLPKLDFPGPKKKTIDIKSPRSKSTNVVKPRRVLLNDDLSKKYGYHAIETKGTNVAKKDLPTFGAYKFSSHIMLNNDKQHEITGQASQGYITDTKRDSKLLAHETFRQKSKTEIKSGAEDFYEKSKNKLNKSEMKETGQFSQIMEHINTYTPKNEQVQPNSQEFREHKTRQPYFDEAFSTEEDKEEHKTNDPKEEKETLTPNELAEYEFLNQAVSINIYHKNSEDDYEKIDVSMMGNKKEQTIIEAINSLKEAYQQKNYPENMIEELDIILDCNYKEMRIAIDFSELSDLFCEFVDNISLDLTRKLKIFAFLLYFCEDALFSISLNFEAIYNKIYHFTHKYMTNKEQLLTVDKGILRKNLNKAYLALHKGFAKDFYLIERDKTELIMKNFIDIMCLNLEIIYEDISPESKFFNSERIIPLFSIFGDDYIAIFKLLFKRADGRSHILEDKNLSKQLVSLLNCINEVIIISTQWRIDHLKEKSKQAFLHYMMNCFDIYLTVFKYYEMFEISETPELGLNKSIEPILADMLTWLGKLMMKKKLFSLLFERAHESHDTPKTSHGIVSGSGIANLIDSFKQFLQNFKLFEEKKLDFEKLLYKMVDFLTQIQNLLKSRTLESDFEMFIEAVLKNPFRKLANRIIKNFNLMKGENYFSKDPLSSIS